MEEFSLTVAVPSADAALRLGLEQGCASREHLLLDLDRLRDLRHRDNVDVVVLDLPGGLDENLTVAYIGIPATAALRVVDG